MLVVKQEPLTDGGGSVPKDKAFDRTPPSASNDPEL